MTKRIVKKPSLLLHVTLSALAIVAMLPVTAAGLVLTLTIVGIVPGFALMMASAVPFTLEQQRYIKKRVAWKSSQEEPEGAERFRKGRGKRNQVLQTLDDSLDYEYDPVLDDMVPVKRPWITED